jgi:glucokinase
MTTRTRFAACCDVGGTKALLGLVSEDGAILARERYLLGEDREPAALAGEIVGRLRSLAEHSGLPWEDAVGVGCSAAIMGDIQGGMIYAAPNMLPDHRNVPFCDMLQAAAGLPAMIEMDAYAAALGESWRGVGAGVDYFVYVVVGTGIGAGILQHGQVFRGWSGTAGEFGHATLDPNGPLCNCGRYGCLEALASGPAIAARARGAVTQGRRTSLSAVAPITTEAVFQAARQGDDVAREVVAHTVEYLAIGLSNLVHLLNPRRIGLGGGVIHGGADLILEPLRRETAARCGPWVDTNRLDIVTAVLGEDAPLLGVARKIWAAVEDRPISSTEIPT